MSIVNRKCHLLPIFFFIFFFIFTYSSKMIKADSFEDYFKSINPQDIQENILKLVGEDFTVITAGKIHGHNSMTASYGGIGILFGKPTTWCFLRSNRRTLELIRSEQIYTMSYFPDSNKEDVVFFGSKSGRDSNKMKESKLSPISTPNGGSSYKEAKLIIECRLVAINTVNPDDYFTSEGQQFVEDGFAETKDYHKLVFGEITSVWEKK